MPATTSRVDPSNAAQAEAWDGTEGGYWAAHAERFDRSLARYQSAFLAAAEIEHRSAVLDIGCGTGETTRAAARLASGGSAVGIDLSAEMIGVARRTAVPNATFVQGDAQIHPFADAAFDRVISRTGSMFFGAPEAAFANIARAMRPRARLTLLTWQAPDRNEWIGSFAEALTGGAGPGPGGPGPFSQSDPATLQALLQGAGFGEIGVRGLSEPMCYGRDVEDAYTFVMGLLGWMLEGRDETARREAGDRLRATLDDHLTAGGVTFASAAWLVTAQRV